MIPLRDNIPTREFPYVNYAMIAICGLVFMIQLSVPEGEPSLVERLGMIPARVSDPNAEVDIVVSAERVMTDRGPAIKTTSRAAAPSMVPPWMTLLTCIFLHGGWLHFLGNMWFLHIFGDNIEDRFGHLGYAFFYLGCGVAASLVHYLSEMGSTIPTIGASGAIAGVMGAYFVWYRHAQVLALVPIFVIIRIMVLPAPIFLGIWFAIQMLQGTTSIVSAESGGVAWWAHIGGFAVGAGLAYLLGKTSLTRPANQQRTQVYRPWQM